MKAKIIKKDIKHGERNSCADCPIALAVKRMLKLDNVLVYSHVRVIDNSLKATYYKLPKKATDFILKFDEGHTVKPFTFELRVDKKLE